MSLFEKTMGSIMNVVPSINVWWRSLGCCQQSYESRKVNLTRYLKDKSGYMLLCYITFIDNEYTLQSSDYCVLKVIVLTVFTEPYNILYIFQDYINCADEHRKGLNNVTIFSTTTGKNCARCAGLYKKRNTRYVSRCKHQLMFSPSSGTFIWTAWESDTVAQS